MTLLSQEKIELTIICSSQTSYTLHFELIHRDVRKLSRGSRCQEKKRKVANINTNVILTLSFSLSGFYFLMLPSSGQLFVQIRHYQTGPSFYSTGAVKVDNSADKNKQQDQVYDWTSHNPLGQTFLFCAVQLVYHMFTQ